MLGVLLALAPPAAAERRAPEKPDRSDAAIASTNQTAGIFLQLDDGSRLLGTASIQSFPIQTSYAKMEIPFALIDQIRFDNDHQTVTISLKNGDRQQGSAAIDRIELQTLFGKVNIDRKHILHLQMKDGRGDSTGVATPHLDPAQQREMADTILNELRMTQDALDQYALENNLQGTARVRFDNLTPYLKTGSQLLDNKGKDSLGNPLLIGPTVSGQVRVSPKTKKTLSAATGGDEFWGPYS